MVHESAECTLIGGQPAPPPWALIVKNAKKICEDLTDSIIQIC